MITKKPNANFPLTPHPRGVWCKKVRGKLYSFGSWDDPDSALKEYLAIQEELQAGIDPCKRAATGALDVGDLVNLWLAQQQVRMEAGGIRERTYCDYKAIGTMLIEKPLETAIATFNSACEIIARCGIRVGSESPAPRSRAAGSGSLSRKSPRETEW